VQKQFSPSYQKMMRDDWNANPFQSPYTPWIIQDEGASVLLSALTQINPDYQVNLETETIASLVAAVLEARPRWFPVGDAWKRDVYALIKMRLIEHDVRLDTIDYLEVLDWMNDRDMIEARIGDLQTAIYGEASLAR
jgi:hypothetical protein